MASWSKSFLSSTSNLTSPFSYRPLSLIQSSSSSFRWSSSTSSSAFSQFKGFNLRHSSLHQATSKIAQQRKRICRAAEYKFPDPIPEFADAEIEKFKTHLHKKLSKKGIYGDSLEEVVGICTEIFNDFLHTHYGGPGTLLVDPFADMADTLNNEGLPGGPQAARAAVKWAQEHVDKDWKEWNGDDSN